MIARGDDWARLHAAAQALEALVVKQLVVASKAFTGGSGAGSEVRAGLFADALADAMVKGGGLGLAGQLERSLSPRLASAGSGADERGRVSLAALPRSVSLPPSPIPSGEGESAESGWSEVLSLSPLGGERAGERGTITSHFGLRQDPFGGHLTRHQGVDLRGAEGEAIRAAGRGVVRRAGALGGYGEAVEIDHGGGLTTFYAHASQLLVREGDTVSPEQVIARVGHSGRATGPHLHFEVRQDGKALDPEALLDASGASREVARPAQTAPDLENSVPDRPSLGAPRLRANRALKIYARRADETSESGS